MVSPTYCNVETQVLPFGDNTFDRCCTGMMETFQHLRSTLIFPALREIFGELRPDGRLVVHRIFGPPEGSVTSSSAGKHGRLWETVYTDEYKTVSSQGLAGHIREYTSIEVSDFLQAIGFSVQSVVYRGATRIPLSARPLEFFRAFARFFVSRAPTLVSGQ